MNWTNFWSVILDGMSLEHFAAYTALMLAGAIVFFTAADVRKAKRKTEFSWGFLIRDNIPRFVSVLIVIMATVLWYDSFFGVPINAKLAFMQGLSIDAVMGVVAKMGKDSGPLKRSRAKLVAKYKK